MAMKRTPGVGDFDTSDLPGGHKPTNDYHPDRFPGMKPSSQISRITGRRVDSLKPFMYRGHEIKINRYPGDPKLQVFIDDTVEDVYLDDLDNYIDQNTR
jgi:hypothetical protein